MESGMAEQKTFLLRMDDRVLKAMRQWAADELRSLNGQIEYVLRQALREAGRLPGKKLSRPEEGKPGSSQG
jgi:hypothetical protein